MVTSNPCRAATRAASSPLGPPPTTSTLLGLSVLVNFSGCHPRRHSSPAVAFCVQRTGTPSCQLAMQILQPMHSRISSLRPSLILVGKKGSAILARAPPIKSSTPRRICETIVSGEVKRPTPTTGRSVTVLTKSMIGSWAPSGRKREAPQSWGLESILTSHKSGTSDNNETTPCASLS